MFLFNNPRLPGRKTRRMQQLFLMLPPPVPMPNPHLWMRRRVPLMKQNPQLDRVVRQHLRLRMMERQRLAPMV